MMAAFTESIAENKAGIIGDQDRHAVIVNHVPFYYSIHLNEPCNQACIMCVPSGNHGRSELSYDAFVDLFDQIKPFAEHVTLIGGETLMYPHIAEVLELLSSYPIAVTINTNATMLGGRIDDRLLSLHELHLKCSIDAVTPETYRRIRGRDHFARVTERLRQFADRARAFPNIHLIPVYVVMRENLHEVVPFLDFAETLSPQRVEFHPVRHVGSWLVENGTGWTFDGSQQVCESFPDEFNETMRAAAARAAELGIDVEVHFL
jgi:MoaA/NifB/PqqE/SkfB family radical SAM enzyme